MIIAPHRVSEKYLSRLLSRLNFRGHGRFRLLPSFESKRLSRLCRDGQTRDGRRYRATLPGSAGKKRCGKGFQRNCRTSDVRCGAISKPEPFACDKTQTLWPTIALRAIVYSVAIYCMIANTLWPVGCVMDVFCHMAYLTPKGMRQVGQDPQKRVR